MSDKEERSQTYGLKRDTLWNLVYGVIVFMGICFGYEIHNGLMLL